MMLMLWITERSAVFSYSNSKPKELIRNENIDTNYFVEENEELVKDIDNIYDIYYKKYDKAVKENVIHKITASEFLTIRKDIKKMYDELQDPFINIKSFFEVHRKALSIISESFDHHIPNYDEFREISSFIKNSAKNTFEEIKSYTNIL